MNWYARSAREEEMIEGIRGSLGNFVVFCKDMSGMVLRGYQKAPARAILRSILEERGDTIVVLFPRQSGKNELQAQIETYLLTRFSLETCEMVKVSPTWKPQSLNAMRRLERVLSRNVLIRYLWRKEAGYAYAVGQARLYFMSGAPEAHIVGATANTLLEVDEAQDVLPTKFDKDILPMAASTNATRVFWGTAWTSQTLLAHELSAAREAEKRDGVQRVFVIDAGRVAQEVPAYGKFVAEQVSRLGRFHPLIKTQFYSETIDAETGLFPASRLGLMRGDHLAEETPHPASQYALLLDVGGADENPEAAQETRDSTSWTVVAVEPAAPNLALLQAPTYRVVARAEWVGVDHNLLLKELRDLAKPGAGQSGRCSGFRMTRLGARGSGSMGPRAVQDGCAMWINPDQDEFVELPLPRPTVLPDEIFLLGETSAKDYVPLQVDDEDRLVVELVNPDYIARLPVNLSAVTAVLVEDTPGWVYQIMLFNHSGSAVVVQLWYADAVPGGTARVFWVSSVPANFYVQIDCHLEIGDSLLYAAASTVDVVKILCCMHKGIQYVRGT